MAASALRRAGAAAVLVLAACDGSRTLGRDADGFTPDPEPEPGDLKLVVTTPTPTVPLGGDIVFRVKVTNGGSARARVNRPRLSSGSFTLRVRSDVFDAAWVSRTPIRESKEGAQPDPETVAEIPPGGSVEADVTTTAVLPGRLTFAPVYTWQGAPGPLTADALSIDVTADPAKPRLGWRLETSHGTFEARLRPDLAYGTCEAIASLAKRGFYDGLTFHRAVRGFMIQGGDPSGEGWGGPGFMLRRELSTSLRHRRGVLSMARQSQPDTAGSQFFVMFGDATHLDRSGYTTFGEVVDGETTLARLESVAADPNDPSRREKPSEKVTILRSTLVTLP